MSKLSDAATLAAILIGGALAAAGWVMNLIAIIHLMKGPITAEILVRGIAVFVWPIGCILGWVS
jgi:hypothetical protein